MFRVREQLKKFDGWTSRGKLRGLGGRRCFGTSTATGAVEFTKLVPLDTIETLSETPPEHPGNLVPRGSRGDSELALHDAEE